jgi:invasion protein IalB
MTRTWLIAGAALAAALGVVNPAAAQTKLADYGDWMAFTDGAGKDKVCYIGSKPKGKAGNYKERGETYVLVTHRPAEKTRNVYELRAGYTYKDGSEVDLSIDGGKPFKLFTKEGTAWAVDASTDTQIAEALRKGKSMVVTGISSRGTKTTDTYSLTGFAAAHDRIGKECGIK